MVTPQIDSCITFPIPWNCTNSYTYWPSRIACYPLWKYCMISLMKINKNLSFSNSPFMQPNGIAHLFHSYFYGATHISTEPLKFLRSHSYFYGVTHISTESLIFLRSHSYFYGVTHISTESLIFLRSRLYFYGATHISTEPLKFLRSHSYFYGASYISMEHVCFHGAYVFQ